MECMCGICCIVLGPRIETYRAMPGFHHKMPQWHEWAIIHVPRSHQPYEEKAADGLFPLPSFLFVLPCVLKLETAEEGEGGEYNREKVLRCYGLFFFSPLRSNTRVRCVCVRSDGKS